jgi:hypothetical protein
VDGRDKPGHDVAISVQGEVALTRGYHLIRLLTRSMIGFGVA